MEQINSKDFFEKLNSGNLKPASKLLGIVKKSDNESEVLFAFKHDMTNWIKIPAAMVESVSIIKNFPGEEGTLTLAKVQLKEPSNSEAKVLYELLASLSAKVNKYMKRKWLLKMLFGEDKAGHQMHGRCMHRGMEDKWEHRHGMEHH